MKNGVCFVCRYYSQFQYPPTEREIHTFYPHAIRIDALHKELDDSVRKKYIYKKRIFGTDHFQIPQCTQVLQSYAPIKRHSLRVRADITRRLAILRYVPTLLFLGISGSLSMLSASKKSDIDLFVITREGAIWQTRFLLLLYKKFLQVIDPHMGKSLCFNLFFAENGLRLPKIKQTLYGGHELLQLVPLVDKCNISDRLIFENRWVREFFPNVQIKSELKNMRKDRSRQSYLGKVIENYTKNLQEWWLRRKGIRFDYRGAQLWLIQDDYSRKLKL